ncbi:MAG: M20/M25/M40 family metallo-hydrolase, partial [Streptosporangiaceae bacterium]
MENKDVQRRSGSTRRTFLSASAVTAVAAPIVAQSATASAAPVTGAAAARSANPIASPTTFDPALRALLRQIDPNRVQAIIQKLVSFGTRHTLSSQTDPNRGIGAATAYVTQQMQSFAAASNGRMTVRQQTFVQPAGPRIPTAVSITNVIATIKGTASPERFYVVTGHLDSRCTDVLDFTNDAPGADDDGSGVAVVLELARVFSSSNHQFPGTLIFATVTGEEQGLFGSAFMATQMNAAGNDVQAMFSNDIVGASKSFDGFPPDPFTLRLFVEGVPTNASANDIQLLQLTGGENDSKSRQLGRFALDAAPFNLTNMNIRTIWRRDRYLRASDHVSFETFGYPAARFTEPRENFNHEHQNVRVENGVQFGDLIDFVDFDFVARVARVNAATVWALATAPGTPKNLQIHTNPPTGLPGTNLTTLTWNANPESNLAKYEVVKRETTAADWTDVID